eukprot:CAMPEP_0197190190 /NCGR_PEP_ID=MMETSP1423-20130617/21159_1 /TAXON_ID=476441 /ORGANISM="Pseudo-nitzschia heimii, Strain UNC1101" /LENGTH=96 /DNA_ID=CAMNT_0042642515 /DNA_START=242 /DNA_END=531 /DNA_ORIENTATION=-
MLSCLDATNICGDDVDTDDEDEIDFCGDAEPTDCRDRDAEGILAPPPSGPGRCPDPNGGRCGPGGHGTGGKDGREGPAIPGTCRYSRNHPGKPSAE